MALGDGRRHVVYVASSNYSGSTLLAMLLNALPGVVSIGEMGPAGSFRSPGYLCSCDAPVVECPFFRDVARRISLQQVEFDLSDMRLRVSADMGRISSRLLVKSLGSAPLDALRDRVVHPVLARDRLLADLRHRVEAFVVAALDATGTHVFADTTKSPARIPFLAGCAGLRLSVIHLVRDPRAQVFSALKHRPDRSVAFHARSWVRRQRSIERCLDRLTDTQRLLLRYENLCRAPDVELERVAGFLGLAGSGGWERYANKEHHIIGNRMRRARPEANGIRLDEKWRTGMSPEHQAAVMRIAGRQASRYA